MDRIEEKRLVARASTGDRDAFASLYREHVQTIYRYVYYRVSDAQQAEDITSDVFIKAVEGIAGYQDTGKPFIAWLYRIAYARVVDHYRRRDRRPTRTDIDAQPLPVEVDMDEHLMQQRATDILQQAIANLTEDQQQVIMMRFVEGYSIQQTADALGKKPNAIKALQHRATRSLAGQLERSGLDIETILAGL